MKKLYTTVLIIAVCSLSLFSVPTQAQDGTAQKKWFDRRKAEFLNQIGISASVSTLGFGIEGITALNDQLYLRVGANYLPASLGINDKIAVEDSHLASKIGGYYPDYDVKFKPTSLTGHVLLNYYPTQFNNFHITGGLYVGITEIEARGHLINPSTGERSELVDPVNEYWPTLSLKGYELNVDNGILNADIRLGHIVKPYIGIGYSRPIPKYKGGWGFNWDFGFLIQPTYDIRQGGHRVPKQYRSSAIDIDSYFNKVAIWPMMNFQVTFRAK